MLDIYMDLTIAISESGLSYRGRYAASLVESTDLDAADEGTLSKLTGYGDTPLEAAAAVLNYAVAARKRRRQP